MNLASAVASGVLATALCFAQSTCSLNPVFPMPSALERDAPAEVFPAGSQFIDKTGKLVPPEKAQAAHKPASGLIPFKKVTGGSLWGYRDQTGAVKIECQFRKAADFSDSLAAVEDASGKWGFIDATGVKQIQPQFKFAGSFRDGLAAVDLCDKCAYINKSGKRAFSGEFRSCYRFSKGVAKVEIGKGQWAFIDTTGKILASLTGDSGAVALFSEDLIPSEKEGSNGIGFVNRKGEFVIPPRFSAVHPFSEGLAAVAEKDLWGYIDKTGNFVIKPQFCDPANENFGQFQDGLADVCDPKTQKHGFINRQGKLVIPPHFGDPNRPPVGNGFDNGLAEVELITPSGNIKDGYINTKGVFVWSQVVGNIHKDHQ